MKSVHLTAAILLGLLLAIGCGGSGPGTGDDATNATTNGGATDATTNGGSTDTGTTGDPVPVDGDTIMIEGTVVVDNNPLGETIHMDPLNVQTGSAVQFQLVDYSSGGTRTVLPSTNWSITQEATNFALISQATGRLTAGDAPSSSQFLIVAQYRGVNYTAPLKINGRQANLFTQVVDASASVVRGVTLEFFDANGVTVGRSSQPYEGALFATVPTNATSFTVVADDTLPDRFSDLFTYNGNTYTVGDRNNAAPLGASLVIGRNELPNVVLTSR